MTGDHRPTPSTSTFVPVCAIGASAGGVVALQGLFRHLPANLGLAYVVILHLSPDHPSALGDILGGCTRMPVNQVQDGPTLKPDHVYVIPPDRELVIDGDSVTARDFSEPRGKRAPIDMFFRSIAGARGDGIAVILSGAGADGSLGIRAIKEGGGVIMVQEPSEAGFASMPQNAIATGAADFVAPLARLAERLSEVARSKEAVRSLDMDGNANDLRRIVSFLRARTGHDFSSYKRATVMRRVVRRMQVCRTDTFAAYADYLLATPEEAKELFSDLLISVTLFFRDARAFEALNLSAIKPIFDALNPDKEESIRAWVVGCATGEEAYSLAILLHEEAARRKIHPQIQIFASDLDEGALVTAREGRYPRSIEADISDERLARFFVDEGTHYRVRKELRESVLFASHSVIKEPPFMRLDLITCRNLMIYLERTLQQQLCAIFHYSLKPGRYLFLGSAETVETTELFTPIDRDARIYGSRPQAAQTLPILPQFAVPERFLPSDQLPPARFERTDVPATMHASSLEQVAPASVLVDDMQSILHLSPTAGRFLLHSAGPVSTLLPAVVRPELELDLRLALTRALDQSAMTLTHPAVVAFEGERRRIAMHVAPVPVDAQRGARALVFFLDGGPFTEDQALPETGPDEVRRLYAELKAAQEALVASRSGHESSIQDLRATNEELQSINEEYRSTAEELETSKEELQSINEELHTVNAELKHKLASISVAHSDLQNLTGATEIGTLFLDVDLRIKMFTPPITELFNVAKVDIGRTITDFTHRLDYDGIEADARRVLRDLTLVENEVSSRDGKHYVMRLRPYRTVEDRIDGTVVTFVDITDRRHAEAALSRSEQQLRALVQSSSQVLYRMSPDWDAMRDLSGGGFLSDTKRADNDWINYYIPEEDQLQVRSEIQAATDARAMFDLEHRVLRLDGTIGWTHSRAIPILDDLGNITEWFGSASDVTFRKHVEDALRGSEARQRALIEGVPQLVWRAVKDGRLTWASPQWIAYTGQSERESLGHGWLDALHPDDRNQIVQRWAEAEEAGAFDFEYRLYHASEGRHRWFQSRATPVQDESGRIVEWLGTSTDVDDLRRMQERQGILVAELQHRTRNLLGVVRSIAEQTIDDSNTLPAFRTVFIDRLDALARVQGLLSRAASEPITMEALIRSELDALGLINMQNRVTFEGPKVRLSKRTVQTFALALHELATNARKYGSLANDRGALTVTWRVEDGRVVLNWQEDGLDPDHEAQSPTTYRGGYGRELIERALPYALGARTSYVLQETGVHCTIDLPLDWGIAEDAPR